MKKLILILLAFSLSGCYTYAPIQKPYVIISKRPYVWYDSNVTLYLQEYTYQDSLGVINYFFEKDIYKIGDTIK